MDCPHKITRDWYTEAPADTLESLRTCFILENKESFFFSTGVTTAGCSQLNCSMENSVCCSTVAQVEQKRCNLQFLTNQ